MSSKNYLAVDLGAGSGRVILGTVSDENFSLKELYRFNNGYLQIAGKYYWNIGRLFDEIRNGIQLCIERENIIPVSIGIDTWGVDYGLLSGDGTLMGLPYSYRDPRTKDCVEEFTKKIPARTLYELTGTLLAPYNTVFQLYAAVKYHPELIQNAARLLFMPDLIAWYLTGNMKTEHSFATTSQLYNPTLKQWEPTIFRELGVDPGIMQEIVDEGALIGYLDPAVFPDKRFHSIPVVSVLTHDTNSAVTAIPLQGNDSAFISSGTWSLMGYESEKPVITDDTFRLNFTNEGGARNSWHILRNITGLWLMQQCREAWKEKGYSFADLVNLAKQALPFKGFIDIDNPAFLNPADMPDAINHFLERTGQSLPDSHGQLIRIVLESLAFKYRQTADDICMLKGSTLKDICITGGGINNDLLCSFTADATGLPVYTGLAEGTAAGNILIQALVSGQFRSVVDIRKLVKGSTEIREYLPEKSAPWDEAYNRYKDLVMNY